MKLGLLSTIGMNDMYENFETEPVELTAPTQHGWHFAEPFEINSLESDIVDDVGACMSVTVSGFRIGNREQLVMTGVPIYFFGEVNAKMMLPIVQVGERVTLNIAGKGTVKVKLKGRVQKSAKQLIDGE